MSGIEMIPEWRTADMSGLVIASGLAVIGRGYDYCSAAWRNIGVNISGEVMIAHGQTLRTAATLRPTAASGGQVLGSGAVDRVIIKVPEYDCGGAPAPILLGISGAIKGVYVGGRSGTGYEPYTGSGNLCSAFGLWVAAGDQKSIYVQKLEEIHVVAEPSGYPVTYLGEVIPCA